MERYKSIYSEAKIKEVYKNIHIKFHGGIQHEIIFANHYKINYYDNVSLLSDLFETFININEVYDGSSSKSFNFIKETFQKRLKDSGNIIDNVFNNPNWKDDLLVNSYTEKNYDLNSINNLIKSKESFKSKYTYSNQNPYIKSFRDIDNDKYVDCLNCLYHIGGIGYTLQNGKYKSDLSIQSRYDHFKDVIHKLHDNNPTVIWVKIP